MKLRAFASATLATLMATAPLLADAADRRGRHHHHSAPRVSIGVGIGMGFGFGAASPFYEPFDDPFYDHYPPQAWNYVAPPAVPCTAAQLNKVPTDNVNSPDYTYDRIDLARCKAQAAAATAQTSAPPALVGPSGQTQQPASYYFCRSTNAYYPQVGQCAEGWQQVAPSPPGT